jgi:phospholipase/carboxylesterase
MDQPKLPAGVQWVGPKDQAYAASGLVHAVYLPAAATESRPAPLVVMVHGWGGDESVTWVFKQTIPPEAVIITPRAPLQLPEKGFAWFQYQDKTDFVPAPETLTEGLRRLKQFLSSLPALYPVDPARLILMGFSQGAMVSNALALTHPERIKGIVSLAGGLPQAPELLQSSTPLAGLPVFIAHGTRDETVPLSAAQQTRDIYNRLGATVTYREYDAAHKLSSQGMKDLKQWLAEQLL